MFGNVYYPGRDKNDSNKDLDNLQDLLLYMKNKIKGLYCIAGDFNSWHMLWNCTDTCACDKKLMNILHQFTLY